LPRVAFGANSVTTEYNDAAAWLTRERDGVADPRARRRQRRWILPLASEPQLYCDPSCASIEIFSLYALENSACQFVRQRLSLLPHLGALVLKTVTPSL
jgi:hypothetical protein